MIVDYLMMFTKDEGQKLSAAAASDFRLDFGQPNSPSAPPFREQGKYRSGSP